MCESSAEGRGGRRLLFARDARDSSSGRGLDAALSFTARGRTWRANTESEGRAEKC